MQFKEFNINHTFLSVFTPEELEQIFLSSFAFESNSFIINTEHYFFEISVIAKKVTIFYDANFSDDSGIISKEIFFKLLKESPIQYPKVVEIEM